MTKHLYWAPKNYRTVLTLPQAYEELERANGFDVSSAEVSTAAWDFVTREAFEAYCRTTLVG